MRLAAWTGSFSFARGLTAVLALGLVGLVASTACIPDPEGDYKDFRDRTANLAGEQPTETVDAAFDSKPPDQAVTALYVGICVTTLANSDPEQALRFYTEATYAPDAPGSASGKITLSVTPMRGWDTVNRLYVAPATVAKSETRGSAIVAADVPVAASGRFTATLGTVNLTGESNSISGKDAVIESTVLDGRYGAGDRFCSTLGGQLTVPYSFTFQPSKNTCLFQRVNDGDPLPKITKPEFVCPLD